MANIERLQQLLRVAQDAPEHRLHMRDWSEKAECGTAYCLAGFSAIDPWFREHTHINEILSAGPKGHIKDVSLNLGFETPTDALAHLFGISPGDSDRLFAGQASPDSTDPHLVKKADVIANIERLIAGQHAITYPGLEE